MKKQNDDVVMGCHGLEALLIQAVTEGRLKRIRKDLTVYDYLVWEDKDYQVVAETVDGYFLCEEADEAA